MYEIIQRVNFWELADVLNSWDKNGWDKDQIFVTSETDVETRKTITFLTVLLKKRPEPKKVSPKKKITKKGKK